MLVLVLVLKAVAAAHLHGLPLLTADKQEAWPSELVLGHCAVTGAG